MKSNGCTDVNFLRTVKSNGCTDEKSLNGFIRNKIAKLLFRTAPNNNIYKYCRLNFVIHTDYTRSNRSSNLNSVSKTLNKTKTVSNISVSWEQWEICFCRKETTDVWTAITCCIILYMHYFGKCVTQWLDEFLRNYKGHNNLLGWKFKRWDEFFSLHSKQEAGTRMSAALIGIN